MDKKQLTLTIVAILLTAALVCAATIKYEHRKVNQTANYYNLYSNDQKQVTALTTSNGELQATDTELSSQKTQLCNDLSSHKLTDPLCN